MVDKTTEEPVQQRCVKEEKVGIPGLKVIRVFVGCEVLVTLSWGGVTSALVSVSEASSGRGAVLFAITVEGGPRK